MTTAERFAPDRAPMVREFSRTKSQIESGFFMINKTRFYISAMALFAVAAFVSAQEEEGRRRGGRGSRGFDADRFIERMMSYDENEDGKLSKDELPERLAERMFDRLDADGDGLLDDNEMKAFATQRTEAGAGRGGRRGRQGRGRGGFGGAPVGFSGGMRSAQRALRQLQSSDFDADSRQDDLELTQSLQEALLTAKGSIADVPIAPQAERRYDGSEDDEEYLTDFRQKLIEAVLESLRLESAVNRGDSDAAYAAVRKLSEIQRSGHDAFKAKEERSGRGRRGR